MQHWKRGDLICTKSIHEAGRIVEVLPGNRYQLQVLAEASDKRELGHALAIYRSLGSSPLTSLSHIRTDGRG
jgi:hypothetical protein